LLVFLYHQQTKLLWKGREMLLEFANQGRRSFGGRGGWELGFEGACEGCTGSLAIRNLAGTGRGGDTEDGLQLRALFGSSWMCSWRHIIVVIIKEQRSVQKRVRKKGHIQKKRG